MRTTHRFAICLSLLSLVACGRGREQARDTAAASAAASTPAPAPAPITLADVAGKWQVRATPVEGKDTSVTSYVLTATADTTGWTMTYPNRPPIPVRVRVENDSIIIESGQFESVRRKGVKVRTRGAARLQDGRLVGTSVAHYNTKGADSVLHVRLEGTRAP